MDVTFRDDQCRIRTDHAPANFTTEPIAKLGWRGELLGSEG
jgi:hypothetical protein